MKLSIVIPVHNEKENIEPLYKELSLVLSSLGKENEIIWVDDGSDDGSSDILDMISLRDEKSKAIHLYRNFGQTYAMMAGFDQASGDIIVAMDGDNQNDPMDIPRLLKKMEEGYDVVSGWRKIRKDKQLFRIIPSKIANSLISYVAGVKLHDYGCSLKAYRKETLQNVRLYGEMHRFIPIFTAWEGAKVGELEVNHRPRETGSSHYGISRAIRVILDLTLIKFLDKHLQHPIHLYGGFGLINLLCAVIAFVMMLYYKFVGNKSFIETPLPMLTVLFILIGIMAFLIGIVAEILMRTYYEAQNKKPYLIKNIVKK